LQKLEFGRCSLIISW